MRRFDKVLIEALYKEGIIMFGDFRLSSGVWSPYYIDLRKIVSRPRLFKRVVSHYLAMLDEVGGYDVISGIETGSIPLASVLSYLLEIPMIYVRKKRKDFGAGRLIEGSINPGNRIVVIEDVVTTGGSVRYAVESIRRLGGSVDYAVAFIDRMQGAVKNLSEIGVSLISIYRITDIFDVLHEAGLLDDGKYHLVMDYVSGGGDV